MGVLCLKKILCLFLCLIVLLSFTSCNQSSDNMTASSSDTSKIVIKYPTDNSVNGYRVSDSQNESVPDFTDTQSKEDIPQQTLYYANKNSKKFHYKTCGSASTISDQNLYICEDRQELIDNGYTPCSRCKP